MIPYFEVDAFTNKPFSGNTAGVCLLEEEIPDGMMEDIARQNNLPATAFVWQTKTGFGIRWFTPTAELPLCGHASLACAHILYQSQMLPLAQKIVFETRKGSLYARFADGWIELDFPAHPYAPAPLPTGLEPLFKTKAKSLYRTQDRYIIELNTETEVKNFIPDFGILKGYNCILTSPADSSSPYDFVSRYFAGTDGIREDAATGSSHCSLTPFWAARLGNPALHAMQVSRRGGEFRVSLKDERVLIAGQAVTVVAGKMMF
jgi:predicted PhzF superfamily epimerase YddE/YHI9